jgi:RNA polymerase sigma-70 factor, ECF subfamily
MRTAPMALPGKRAAFDRLVSASLPAALAFAARLTGSFDTAEDVVQEAMLQASRSWKTYRGDAQFRTWLFQIVVNTYRNRLKRASPTNSLPDDLVDSQQCSPSDMASASELSQTVARCVAELPLRQREVLVLSTFEGLDATQISQVLEMSVANVYSTLSAARAKLKQQLELYLAEK